MAVGASHGRQTGVAADYVFLLSHALLTEYRGVLLRPEIRTRHGLSEGEVDALLECEPETVLVTGDKPSLENPPRKGAVWSPAVFVGSVLARDER